MASVWLQALLDFNLHDPAVTLQASRRFSAFLGTYATEVVGSPESLTILDSVARDHYLQLQLFSILQDVCPGTFAAPAVSWPAVLRALRSR